MRKSYCVGQTRISFFNDWDKYVHVGTLEHSFFIPRRAGFLGMMLLFWVTIIALARMSASSGKIYVTPQVHVLTC